MYMQMMYNPSLSPNIVDMLIMHCSLGLDYHGVGVMFMDTISFLWSFHTKPSFVMHDGNVLSNFKNIQIYKQIQNFT